MSKSQTMSNRLLETWELEAEVTAALMSSSEPLPGLQDLLVRPAWHSGAACRSTGVAKFFPPEGGSLSAARSVCESCVVTEECLSYALSRPSLKGVWAGTSERRRQALRKRSLAVALDINKAPAASCSG
jgi:WhiB family redox-sensing transcriptional regulator